MLEFLRSFKAASERLELAPNAVAAIAGECPIKMAFAVLQALQWDEKRRGGTVDDVLDKLTALSDGPIKWKHGRGLSGLVRYSDTTFPHVWSSAHEAALEVSRLALRFFFWPLELGDSKELPKDKEPLFHELLAENRRKALAMTLEEIADWQERIRRERAKLLNAPALREDEQRPEPPLKERVLDVLTEQQRKIVEYLWKRNTGVRFDVLADVPGAFRSNSSRSDETILAKKKEINERLAKAGLPVELKVSGRRLKLVLPPG